MKCEAGLILNQAIDMAHMNNGFYRGEKKSIEKTNGGLSKQQINSIILIAALIGLIVSGFFAWDNFKSDYDRLVKKQNNDDVVIDTLNSVLQNTNSSNSSLSDSSQQTINDTLTTSP